jgi:hypothetical protein
MASEPICVLVFWQIVLSGPASAIGVNGWLSMITIVAGEIQPSSLITVTLYELGKTSVNTGLD